MFSQHNLTNSVIICTRNRPVDLLLCLQSLKQQTLHPTELIIVDSSTQALNQQQEFVDFFVESNFPKTQLHYLHTKPGLTYQRNCGIKQASGAILYFFDDDVVLEKNYLEEMQTIFAQHPEYAGGMGSVTNMDAYRFTLFRLHRMLFLLPRDYSTGKFTWSGMPTFAYGNKQFQEVQTLGGCCMAYRRSALQSISFDEHLIRYCYMEDCDVAAQVSFTNKLFYNPKAQLAHNQSPLNRDALVDNTAMFMENYTYLFFKNFYSHNKLRSIAYWWSVVGLLLEAALLRRDKNYCKGYWLGLKRSWFLLQRI